MRCLNLIRSPFCVNVSTTNGLAGAHAWRHRLVPLALHSQLRQGQREAFVLPSELNMARRWFEWPEGEQTSSSSDSAPWTRQRILWTAEADWSPAKAPSDSLSDKGLRMLVRDAKARQGTFRDVLQTLGHGQCAWTALIAHR